MITLCACEVISGEIKIIADELKFYTFFQLVQCFDRIMDGIVNGNNCQCSSLTQNLIILITLNKSSSAVLSNITHTHTFH